MQAGKFLNNQDYDPYGVPYQTNTLSLGYTGELTDPNGLVYLRARTYAPRLGVFDCGRMALDASMNQVCKMCFSETLKALELTG